MMLIELNEATAARRRVPVVLVDDADGKTAETGVTLSAGDMKISKNGAAEANHGGTLTELAGGDYYYEFSAGEVDTVGYLTGRIVKSGVRTFRIAAQVVAFDPYSASNLGLTDLATAVADTNAIKAKTDNLPASPAATGDIPAAATIAAAVWAYVVEGSSTAVEYLRIILSSAAAKLSGAATTTVSIRDAGDTKDRIVATVDADGNRTAVTLDGS